jgi:hypothetical protein
MHIVSAAENFEIAYDGPPTIDESAVPLKVKRSWIFEPAAELAVFKLGKYWLFRGSRIQERLEPGASKVELRC